MITREINNKPYALMPYLKRLRSYGYLISSLSKRELKIKYSRAVLGIGWLLIQPIVSVVIYSIFFNYLIKVNTGNIPYLQFVFSGMVLWYLFTGILGKCSTVLLESTELINKVSFPRIILLIAKAFPVVLESLVLYLVLIGIVIFNNPGISINFFVGLFYLFQVLVLSFSLGILFCIAIVRYRDVLHILPFVMNFGIWLTPVFYPISIIPAKYQDYIKYLNPIANAIEGLRGTLFLGNGISLISFLVLGFSLILLFISFIFFIKFEKKIVEQL